jgi:carbon-monoxide dehydrogenase large subunit
MAASVQVAIEKESLLLGKPLKRLEDPKFITGTATFIDDVPLQGILHSRFVRSAYAHARIKSIDTGRASAAPGVRLVITGKDLIGKVGLMPTINDDPKAKPTPRPVLAIEEVNYVGEAAAVVVADSPYEAFDAAELVEVDYEMLPAVQNPDEALKAGSAKVHEYLTDNVAYRTGLETGDVEKAFRDADEVVELRLINQRIAPVALEPRGALAAYDGSTDTYTVWLTTQDPYLARAELAKAFRIPEGKVRVVAPDMGGAFGSKASLYPEEVVVTYASMQLRRPVKWLETRNENLLSTTHARGQKQIIKAAVRKDGKILGLKAKVITDAGAYTTEGSVLLAENTIKMAPGCYDIPAFKGDLLAIFTNKVPQDAYRGAGRPEAAFLIERTISVIARRLKLDPVKIRLTNFIKADRFPFTSATGYVYDSGNYEGSLRKALDVSDLERLRRLQTQGRQNGRFIGIGLASYVEICGFSPSFPQTASVSVTKHGEVIVTSGTSPHGQGHATPFAQIVADELGIPLENITVKFADTTALPWATITAGSRSAALGGSAILGATRKVKAKMARLAAHLVHVDDTSMEFRGGKIYSKSSPSGSIEFGRVARAAYEPEELPEDMESTLYEYCAFAPKGFVFPFGTHVAVVEVDADTGSVSLLSYFAVDDCGKLLNPLVAEGQVQGGVVQGIGQALIEGVVYDRDGQLLTSTFADYLIPSADTIPNIRWARTETTTPNNPLGVKGIGEAGTIAATPAIVNAVEDALSPFDVTIDRMPLSPDYIRRLIEASAKHGKP